MKYNEGACGCIAGLYGAKKFCDEAQRLRTEGDRDWCAEEGQPYTQERELRCYGDYYQHIWAVVKNDRVGQKEH